MKAVTDHNGRRFRSVRSMLQEHGVAEDTYYKRRRKGKSMREALATSQRALCRGRPIVGHDGIERASIKEYADELGLDYFMLYKRLEANGFKAEEWMTYPKSIALKKKRNK